MFVNNIYNSSAKLILKCKLIATIKFLESSIVKEKTFSD